MSYTLAARNARVMGDFVGYDFVKNPVCPFCQEQWGSQKPCGDQDPEVAGGWRAMAERRKLKKFGTSTPVGTTNE